MQDKYVRLARPAVIQTITRNLNASRNCKIRFNCIHRQLSTISLDHLSTKSDNISAKRHYTNDGYYWIREIKADEHGSNLVEVGLTDHLFNTRILGSIDSVTVPNMDVKNGLIPTASSFAIHWSGLKVGTGDELYHSVWENVDGVFNIEPFLPLKMDTLSISELNDKMLKKKMDFDDDWLMRLQCCDNVSNFINQLEQPLRTREEHEEYCKRNS